MIPISFNIICESLLEYLKLLREPKFMLSGSQIKVRDFIVKSTGIKNPPTYSNTLINAFPEVYGI